MPIGGLLGRIGSGVTNALDRLAYNGLGGGLLGQALPDPNQQPQAQVPPTPQPPQQSVGADEMGPQAGLLAQPQAAPQPQQPKQFQPNDQQRRQMRAQLLTSLGGALSQSGNLGVGIRDGMQAYQQNAIGQLQAGKAAQDAQQHKLALQGFQAEMQAAGSDPAKQQAVVLKYSVILPPQEIKAIGDLQKDYRSRDEEYVPIGDIATLNKRTGVVTPVNRPLKDMTPEQTAFKYLLEKNGGNAQQALADLEAAKQPPQTEKDPGYDTVQTDTGIARLAKTGDQTPIILKGANGKPLMPAKTAASNVSIQMSPAALDQAANMYHDTGTLISAGMGKDGTAMRTAIMNREGELYPKTDLASAKTDYLSNQGAIKGLEKTKAQVLTFENTAGRNLDLADSLSKQVDRTGSPLINKYLLYAKGQIAGDADTTKLKNAVETAASEYAKVMSGGMSGQVSDAKQAHARDMLSASMSNGTFSQVVALMKQEMGNRRSGYDDQLKELRSGRPGATPAVAQTPASDLINVQIPGQPPGQIHASQKAAFQKKYPNAVIQ